MGVWIRMHQKLFSVGSWRNEGTFDMNLIRVLAGDGQKGVAKGGDVMLNVIYVAEMEGGDLLPQQGVGPDGHGGAVREVAEIFRFWCSDAWFWYRGELA
jgi:hypothetical protein